MLNKKEKKRGYQILKRIKSVQRYCCSSQPYLSLQYFRPFKVFFPPYWPRCKHRNACKREIHGACLDAKNGTLLTNISQKLQFWNFYELLTYDISEKNSLIKSRRQAESSANLLLIFLRTLKGFYRQCKRTKIETVGFLVQLPPSSCVSKHWGKLTEII